MMRRLIVPVILAIGISASAASAQSSHVLVITGVGGEPKYTQQFDEWARKLVDAARSKHGVPAANIAYLPEKQSQKANVEKAFADLAARSKAGDPVLIVLIGHGSAEGGEPRFNLMGPDLNAKDYARLLDALQGRKIAIINGASSSGAFLEALTERGRTVITATRSGMERNETIFPKFFAEAYAGTGADTDKDGKVSLLEAYTYTTKEVDRWYKEQNRMVTEHAQLDDDGDGKGTAAPDGRSGDGTSAKSFLLGAATNTNASPELRALLDEKREIEQKIEGLRAMKARMETAAYEKELEKLLLELTAKNQQIKKLEAIK